jgi:Flp pilus assembly protein TadD
MDADDRLTPAEVIRLKQAAASGQAEVYMCRVVSAGMKDESSAAIVEHLRLFRNGRGVQFNGPLHESVMADALAKGLVIARTNITVTHTGYTIEVEDYQAKARRNMAIINAQLARRPDDLYWRYHRAASLTILGDLTQAAADYEAVIADLPPDLHWDIYIYQAHTGLVHLYYDGGQTDDARRVLELALTRFPKRRHLAILAGMFYLNHDEPDKALAALQRARQLPEASDALGQAWPPGKLERTLGQVYVLQGQFAYARDIYRQMLARQDRLVQMGLPSGWAETQALVEQADYQAAFDRLEPQVDGNPAALRLLAEVQHRQGQWRSAAACLAQAMALNGPHPTDPVKLAEYILHTRHFDSAHRLCELALAANPENADALNLLGFIAMQRHQPEEAMTYLLHAWFSSPEHGWVRNNLEQLAAGLGLLLPEAINQYGARMLKAKSHAFAAVAFTMLAQLAPANPQPYKALAVALNALGREAEAMQAWQTAQALAQPQ